MIICDKAEKKKRKKKKEEEEGVLAFSFHQVK
jgi:hypothetical protein